MSDQKLVVGISQGDINGIGLEVILKTFQEVGVNDICTPVLFSSQKTVSYYRKVMGIEEFNFHPLRDLTQINHKKVNVFVCYEEEVNIEMGKASDVGGKYAAISLEKATESLLANKIDVLVTAPINKHTIKNQGFNFIGHTDYLGKKLNGTPLMVMCTSSGLRVALATDHVPLKDVVSKLSVDVIAEKINAFHLSLVRDFGVRKPRLAILGINPHASDNGTIGDEDQTLLKPAIDKARGDKMIYGPYSADGFFGSGAYKQFDGILAMYHDQGLIPFKTLAFNEGVNYTAGLSHIRTSPDHGTAYEIAGKNQANEQSFKNALYMAMDIHKNRKLHSEITANPLQHTNIKKER
jgi:4-hydroxythreonine-4-phosphate dehydrogenase